MDPTTLRGTVHRVLASNPELAGHISAKEGNVLIAILRHDVPLHTDLDTEDFMWVKGKKSVKGSRLREAYAKNHGISDLSFTLKLGNINIHGDTRLETISACDDGLVVLTAETSTPRPAPSGPLSASLHEFRYPTQAPPRVPLQPVNRQLSAPNQARSEPDTPTRKTKSPMSTSRHEVLREGSDHPRTPSHASPSRPDRTPTHRSSARSNQTPPRTPRNSQPELSQATPYRPREMADPFAALDEPEPEVPSRGGPLRDLAHEELPERLEAAVKVGVDVLNKLQEPLGQLDDHPDATSWLDQIENVRKEAIKTRTVVGVVGNTGAGKSSVINAMLDEERLVPTNCMRACTAVVTELSYNYSDLAHEKYRAEIEFIRPKDWEKELEILFQEVFEGGHLSRDVSNPDSQAGIAYAKIRAVYHKFTNEMLSKASVENLMRVKKVKNILGKTRRLQSSSPKDFYKQLQQYVDTVETVKLDKNGNKAANQPREFQFWPLIKVVKIYTKAEALSKGSVIVDLPGVHDTNAARAAVAEGYMKSCTGLWIVAPITRAVDDKAAKTLLGSTFRRQLKYDGIYSAVTFICSKTDDISQTEAADSLQLELELAEVEQRGAQLARERREKESELESAKGDRKDYAATIEELDERIDLFDDLGDRLNAGETVYEPSSRKRKRASVSNLTGRKRRRSSWSDDEKSAEAEEGDDDEADEGPKIPLTQKKIDDEVDGLKKLKRKARNQRTATDERIRELEKEIEATQQQEEVLEAQSRAICIAGRNEYSRGAIRHDFAAGIRELDQETAEEEDPDNFNPEEDIRDYQEVADSLPVFCVSSRAYQKLSGRLQKDSDVPGFTTLEQTEIPQLKAHCMKLTERGRQATCRRFLNALTQLVNSLGLWCSDDGSGARMSSQQRDSEKTFLMRKLKDLEKALEKAVDGALDDCMDDLGEQLFAKFGPAADAAAATAVTTADGWGAPKDAGGLLWATYKATVRREGVFAGSAGLRDFNAALSEPIYKHLATAWEKLFQRRLPSILQSFTRSGAELLMEFHAVIEARCRETGHGIARLGLLATSLTGYQAIFQDLARGMIDHVNESQREINRMFTPAITAAMQPAYELCVNESGQGSFKRMKAHMHDHVETARNAMFTEACERVGKSLKEVCEDVRKSMLDRCDKVFLQMRKDYMSIVGGVNVEAVSMSREERAVRRQLDEILTEADNVFQEVVDCQDLAELKGFKDEIVVDDAVKAEVVDDDEEQYFVDDWDDDDDEENSCDEGRDDGVEEEEDPMLEVSKAATVETDTEGNVDNALLNSNGGLDVDDTPEDSVVGFTDAAKYG